MKCCAFVSAFSNITQSETPMILIGYEAPKLPRVWENPLHSSFRLALCALRSLRIDKGLAFRTRYASHVSVANSELPLSQVHSRDRRDHPTSPASSLSAHSTHTSSTRRDLLHRA